MHKTRCRLAIRNHLICFLCLALVISGSVIHAGQVEKKEIKSFSLISAQQYAVQHSYNIRKSKLDVAASRKKLKETVASGLPQVSSGISYINNLELATILIPNFFDGKFDEKIPVQFGTQHTANFNITVNQLIFNGSYFVGLQTASIYRRLADQGLEQTELTVKETVTSTYYLILVSEESEKILKANLENLGKTLYEITETYKEGFVAETDVDLLQISYTKLKNGLQTVQRQKETAYNLLKFQMGIELKERISLTEKLEDILSCVDVKKFVEADFDLENNLDYKLLVTQERLLELSLKNEKSKYFPTVAAFYTYQQSAMRDAFNFFNFDEKWFRAQFFGVNIDIPIFKSGAQKAKVQQAAITLDQMRNTREQAAQGILLEAFEARVNLESAYENYLNTKDNMALSEKVYNATLIKYREGMASSMDLTQANDKYLQSQSDYIQAMAALLNAKNSLDKISNNY